MNNPPPPFFAAAPPTLDAGSPTPSPFGAPAAPTISPPKFQQAPTQQQHQHHQLHHNRHGTPRRQRRGRLLSVIEEDVNDSSCLGKGQLKKQTAVQCLASLANNADGLASAAASPTDSHMDMEVEDGTSLMQQPHPQGTKTPLVSAMAVPEASSSPSSASLAQEDDWGHFYADASSSSFISSGEFSMMSLSSSASSSSTFGSKRRMSGSKRHRRSHVSKYPRAVGRCGPSPANAHTSAKQLSCFP